MSNSQSDIIKQVLKSRGVMQVLSEFIPRPRLLEFNFLNKQFYNEIIPHIMENRQMYPLVNKPQYLFIKN